MDEPTLEQVDSNAGIIWAIRSRYALINDSDIAEVLELLERIDEMNHFVFNAQVDAEYESDLASA